MKTEEINMITWAFEHPYLYFWMEIKPPVYAIVILIIVQVIKILISWERLK